jgi:hypothetical protein
MVALVVGFALLPAAALGADSIYWTNQEPDAVSFAHLDGSGGADLSAQGATLHLPEGIALDPATGRAYWANVPSGKISFANLDGSGGGQIKTGGATMSHPFSPALLVSPRSTAAPAITGEPRQGATLSCSQGAWAADIPVSFLYEAPQRFAFQWSRNGRDIPGATQSSLSATAAGEYRCRVAAQNHAGSTTQASGPLNVPATAFEGQTGVTLTLLSRRIAPGAPLKVRVTNANAFMVAGILTGQTTKRVGSGPRPRLKAKKLSIAAHARKTIKLRLPKPLQQLLSSQGKLSLGLTATVRDLAGNKRSIKKTIVPKLRGHPRPPAE